MACLRDNPGGARAEAKPRVIDALRAGLDDWLASNSPTPEQTRFLRDLKRCRTRALGGHLYLCPRCDCEIPVYNTCGNRHCPNCQALNQERWIERRAAVLLPIGHHHVVFTLPSQLRSLARRHPREMYSLLFRATAETLHGIAKQMLGARLGFTAVLHTWRRDLGFHPHLHCIVTAGALEVDDSRWIERTEYLFPVSKMKTLFRSRVLHHLSRIEKSEITAMSDQEWRQLIHCLPRSDKWVMHIQPPFGRSTHVLQYLGRYTHRIAISDARIISIGDSGVRFTTRDGKIAQLSIAAFLNRFLMHVLPSGFNKMRHYGLYAPANMSTRLPLARKLIQASRLDDLDDGFDTTDDAFPSSVPEAAFDPNAFREKTPTPALPAAEQACPRCGHVGLFCYRIEKHRTPPPLARPP